MLSEVSWRQQSHTTLFHFQIPIQTHQQKTEWRVPRERGKREWRAHLMSTVFCFES